LESGKDEPAAVAICYASIVQGKSDALEYGFVFDAPKSVKAAGDYELDVLAVPFGGQNNGRDSDGERFTPQTDIMHEAFSTIPVFLYHGMDARQRPVSNPEPIGIAKYDHLDERGHWYKVFLNKASSDAVKLWQAAIRGTLRASSGAIAHLVRVARDGEILQWAATELSLFDAVGSRQPANAYAVATPAAKAHLPYEVPSELDEENTGTRDTPEAETSAAADAAILPKPVKGAFEMDELEISKLVAAELEKQQAAKAAVEKSAAEEAAKIEAAVKMEREKWEANLRAVKAVLPARPHQLDGFQVVGHIQRAARAAGIGRGGHKRRAPETIPDHKPIGCGCRAVRVVDVAGGGRIGVTVNQGAFQVLRARDG